MQAAGVVEVAVKSASTIVPENVAIVKLSGLLVVFLYMDNSYSGSINISQEKARTAGLFNGLNTARPDQTLQGTLVLFAGRFDV